MLNNLYGDFVKGRDLSEYPIVVQKGLRLHREIDFYIDNHPAVLDLTHKLFEHLPKVSGIAVDLYFDHLLAKKWGQFHPENLNAYLEKFYSSIDTSEQYYSTEFRFMIEKLISKNWISYYSQLEGLDKVCKGVSGRISFPNTLVHGKDVFLDFEVEIEKAFEYYMKDAILKFSK
jgi:acyl carrier protein phosphodiesterase